MSFGHRSQRPKCCVSPFYVQPRAHSRTSAQLRVDFTSVPAARLASSVASRAIILISRALSIVLASRRSSSFIFAKPRIRRSSPVCWSESENWEGVEAVKRVSKKCKLLSRDESATRHQRYMSSLLREAKNHPVLLETELMELLQYRVSVCQPCRQSHPQTRLCISRMP